MASAGTVTVDFAAETARFTSELKRVQGSLSRVEGSFKSLDRVAGVAMRVFSGEVLFKFARQALDVSKATADAAAGINQANAAIAQLTTTLNTYTSKFAAGLSIAILGPPNAILKLDEEIEDLQRRRDALLSGGLGRGSASTIGRQAALAEVERINKQIRVLLDEQRDLLNRPATPNAFQPLPAGIEIDLAPIRALRIETDGVKQMAEAAAAAYTNASRGRSRSMLR